MTSTPNTEQEIKRIRLELAEARKALAPFAKLADNKPEAGEGMYRFLVRGDIFEATDEHVTDGGDGWEPVMRQVIGQKYIPGIFKTVRRRISASASPVYAGAAEEIDRLTRQVAHLDSSNQTVADELGNEINRLQSELSEARRKAFEGAAQIAEQVAAGLDQEWRTDTALRVAAAIRKAGEEGR